MHFGFRILLYFVQPLRSFHSIGMSMDTHVSLSIHDGRSYPGDTP